jgi:protein-tyrosine-phosphatase
MYFFSIEELTAALATGRLGEVLVQEYCPGYGVGIEMLIHGGECVAAFQHRRLKEAPITGGVAVMAIAEEPTPDLAQASFDLLRALQWEGVAMVEFRVNPENGRAVLMEVNGRYWGTSSLPFLAGVDFPLYQWQLLHGEPPVVPPNYAVGMRWRWTAGYLARMHAVVTGSSAPVGPRVSRWQELSSVPADLIAPSVRDALWSWSDPVPALADTASAVLEWTKADLTWLLRKVVPQKAVFDLGVYRRLGPKAGPKFLKLRILDSLRLAWSNRRMVPPQARSFLFICHGNIMRSPMAAEMLSRALPSHLEHDVVVRSAGMHARTGREAERRALLVSRELGIPLDAHQAQPVGPEMVAAADAILAMDFANKAELLARFPEVQDRIFLLSTYAEGKQRFREIPDPYFGDLDEVRRCYQTLQTCIHNLVSTLSPETPRTSGPWRKTAIGV